jgi:hypothetical protein
VCFMECHSASVSSRLHFRFSLDVLRWLSGLFVYISNDYCVIPIRHVTFKLCSRLHFTELFADLTAFY